MTWLYRIMFAVLAVIGLARVEETMDALEPPSMPLTLHALLHPEPPPPPPPPAPIDPPRGSP